MSELHVTMERPAAEAKAVARVRPKANLDFLRAVAVVFVVVDHTSLALREHRFGRWELAWLGTFGVFLFFVHTTLVLMWSLERRPHILDFYIRRVFRIYPLALLAVAVGVITRAPMAGTVENFFGRVPHTPLDILTHCLLLQDLRPGTPPIVNVMWTLPLEVQMYVVLPALFAFARKLDRVWPVVLVWGLAAAFCRVTFDPNMVNLATVVPMFLPGVIAYVAFRSRKPLVPAWMFSVYLLVVTVLFMDHPSNQRGGYVALLLGLGLPVFRELRSPVVVRVSHLVAQYSYGIYLSHPFALVLGMYVLHGYPVWVQLLVELVTIVVVSVGSYHLLELPMIQLGTRLGGRIERYRGRERGLEQTV